jgi:hypothetical protein
MRRFLTFPPSPRNGGFNLKLPFATRETVAARAE